MKLKNIIYSLISIGVVIVSLQACNKKDDDSGKVSQKRYGIFFDLVDGNNNNLVFGDSAKFNLDSFKVYTMDDDETEWKYYKTGGCSAEGADGVGLTTCDRTPKDVYSFTLRTLMYINDTISDTIIIWTTNSLAAKNGKEPVKLRATYNSVLICDDCDQGYKYSIVKE